MDSRRKRQVNRADSRAFMSKAQQFLRTMEKAAETADWDAVGMNAVHSVISAADAVTAFRAGFRSAEQDHRMAADVLEDVVGQSASAPVRHLRAVLAKKNTIEYEERKLTAREAAEVAEHARRFLSWASDALPEA